MLVTRFTIYKYTIHGCITSAIVSSYDNVVWCYYLYVKKIVKVCYYLNIGM